MRALAATSRKVWTTSGKLRPAITWRWPVDAKIILALFLRREQRYAEALQVVNGMQSEYPRNFLMAAEYAHLLNAAGHGQEAITAYRKVLAGCHNNVYVGCKIDIAAYGLGESLRGQKEYLEAAQAYELAALAGRIPTCGRRQRLPPVKCTTCCKSGTPPWRNTRQSLRRTPPRIQPTWHVTTSSKLIRPLSTNPQSVALLRQMSHSSIHRSPTQPEPRRKLPRTCKLSCLRQIAPDDAYDCSGFHLRAMLHSDREAVINNTADPG